MTLCKLVCLGAMALLIAACAGESNFPTPTGTATFRSINAIPSSPSIGFLIEERLLGNADYKSTSQITEFDDLDYLFNFEVLLGGDLLRSRVASVALDVVRDIQYSFLISGDLAAPTITIWEYPRREWEGTETVFDVRIGHAAESLGAVDVYLQTIGIAPALGLQAATLSLTELSATIEYAQGDYALIITTAGNPNDILFDSGTVSPITSTGFTITIFDGDANDVGPIAVLGLPDTGGFSNLVDKNTKPSIRFFHATPNLVTSDVYTDELATDQILANHAYRDVTGDLPLDANLYNFTYTPAGNVGSILHQNPETIGNGTRYQFYIVGEQDNLISFLTIPDRRSIETRAKFSFLHTDTNHASVDIYVVEAGDDIAEILPRFFNIAVGTEPLTANLQAGDFEMYVTVSAEKTVIAGPIAFSPALGDIFDYISYNSVDPATSDIVAIPLP